VVVEEAAVVEVAVAARSLTASITTELPVEGGAG